jgi:hypothetical protein
MINNLENDLLSDDECKCLYCSALILIPFNNKQIPISKEQFNELFPFNNFLKFLNKRPAYIYPSKFIIPLINP